MIKIFLIIFLLTNVLVNSQKNSITDCEDLRTGSFELYDNNLKIGTIYRKGKFQIEKYLKRENYTIAKVDIKDCLFYLKMYEIKEDMDTITWSVDYKKIKKNHYSFIGRPIYLNISYTHAGELKKISNKIDSEMLEIFKELESKTSNSVNSESP